MKRRIPSPSAAQIGIPKASVLPEPVGAVPRMSELGADSSVLIVDVCIGVGFVKP